jgi:hypothetical protein
VRVRSPNSKGMYVQVRQIRKVDKIIIVTLQQQKVQNSLNSQNKTSSKHTKDFPLEKGCIHGFEFDVPQGAFRIATTPIETESQLTL